jgi:two-component system, NtrC family, sensor kinase
MPSPASPAPQVDARMRGEEYYRELLRRNVLRLSLTYLAPMVLLSVYFYFQYRSILNESLANHLRTVAENRASTMDLFLHERIVNLFSQIDDPRLPVPPGPTVMEEVLRKLRQASDAVDDVGFIDETGIQTAYAGPYPELQGRDYGGQAWFLYLRKGSGNYIVADKHLGFRGRPHFTLAVSRVVEGRRSVLRAALDPAKTYQALSAPTEAHDTEVFVVNQAGKPQLLPQEAEPESELPQIVPPRQPRIGLASARTGDRRLPCAYAWLRSCEWALLVVPSAGAETAAIGNFRIDIIAFAVAILGVIFSVILMRAKHLVQTARQEDATRAELADNLIHASKLAAVGQLASGIAHEINNPLAIISEEVGLMQDLSDPKFGVEVTLGDLAPHLESIQDAVVRCRGITSGLLSFVRRGEVTVQLHSLHNLIDDIVNSFYGRGVARAGVKIVRNYCRDAPWIRADRTQVEQVFLNLLNNAIDAMEGYGRITITTTMHQEYDRVRVDVEDTGAGMTQEQLEKIFVPFYSTKQAGRGTGLGLPISYAIIKSMEGEMSVASTQGKGSTFSIILPVWGPEDVREAGLAEIPGERT